MPNIKSQIKRDAKNKEQQARNKAQKSAMKTAIKKFDAAVAAGDKEAAASTYKCAVSAVDRAAGKNLIHKNNAAHKKAALDKKLNTLALCAFANNTDDRHDLVCRRFYFFPNCAPGA